MRRLLLGDWGPWIRDPIDLLRLSFLVGIVVFAVVGFLADLLLRTAAVPWVRWSRT